MIIFEYLAIAFGLLYSVAALRLLGGLPFAFDPDRRYWVHTSLAVVLLIGIAASFWTFWSLHDVEWTFPRFLVALTVPGVMYYCAAVLVPENPEEIRSWRAHYFAVHRRWFIGVGLWGVAASLTTSINGTTPLLHPSRAAHVGALVLGVLGSSTSNPRVHAGIVVGFVMLLVMWGLTVGLRPR